MLKRWPVGGGGGAKVVEGQVVEVEPPEQNDMEM